MRCRSCNVALSDGESSRKYKNLEDIKNPEDQYIGLCDGCMCGTVFYEDDLKNELIDLSTGETDGL